MNDAEVAELARKIGEHRFTGYSDDMLADEIEFFRSGRGIGGLSEAVAALEAVSDALAETDDTLRTELAKLGVQWHGAAGGSARSRLAEEAEFSRSAGAAGTDSAQRLFAQGEAFNRTLHKLPDPAALRADSDVGIGDSLLSLIGHETDAVRAAERKKEAREQAEQALGSYAQDSGEKLRGLPELPAPDLIGAAVRGDADVPGSIGAGGGPDDSTTAAHSTGSVPPGPAPSAPFTPGAVGTS
ncbi:PPE domain-containing protein, partial [Saccharomonospora iraqiensis]|uniref:PPE domain-containing protein n=1 Tax=Saccharomonospora iraqiensis TaxID=52698 RepID=UPI00047C9D90